LDKDFDVVGSTTGREENGTHAAIEKLCQECYMLRRKRRRRVGSVKSYVYYLYSKHCLSYNQDDKREGEAEVIHEVIKAKRCS
jgi:hypothetical protein